MASRELLVVTGKGGVGKSTVAAALGLAAARHGPTLVLETDPRENVHRFLSVSPSAGEVRKAAPNLFLQSLRPMEVVDSIVSRRLKVRALARKVMASPIYRHFTEGAPGLKELAVLWQALQLVRGKVRSAPDVERVILDAPATGHGVSLLLAPVLVSEVVDQGPVAEMTREVADWVQAPRAVGVVVVTQAEEMPVTEAIELQRELSRQLDRRPDAVIANGLYPPLFLRRQPTDPVGRLWWRRRRLQERELKRLASGGRPADLELPLLPIPSGPELVGELARRCRPLLEMVPA